jgi:hypothetical protein
MECLQETRACLEVNGPNNLREDQRRSINAILACTEELIKRIQTYILMNTPPQTYD